MRSFARNAGPLLAAVLLLHPVLAVRAAAEPVTLPNGLTLELVGVTTGRSLDRAWWKPDGSPLDAPAYEQPPFSPQTRPGDVAYELAVRVSGLKDERPETSIERIGKFYVGGAARPFTNGEEVRDLFVFTVTVPAREETATVEFAVGANEWRTLHTFKGPGTYGDGPTKITVKRPDNPRSDRPGQPPPFFYVTALRGKTALRLVAVDDGGKEHVSTGGQWWGANDQTVPAVFPGLTPESVREYRLQSLPYHPVAFKDVSLRPKPEAVARALQWRAQRLRKLEDQFAADAEAQRRLSDALFTLRSSRTVFDDTDAWAKALRDVAEAGPPALPLVLAEMNRTAKPYVRSNLAIALRGIGDARAIPGLAAALRTTAFAPNDYGGSQVKDEKLRRYVARFVQDEREMGFHYGRPVNEITESLVTLSGGHSEGDEHRRKNERRLYEEASLKWAQWWQQNAPSVTQGLPEFRGAYNAKGEPVDLAASLNGLEQLLRDNPEAAGEKVAGEWTRLHVAAAQNRLFEATLLMANGVDPRAACYGWTPLHLAAAAGAQDVVARLLEKKLDPNAKTPAGQTVLHAALGLGASPAYGAAVVYQPDLATVKALLAAGADVRAADADGTTTLHAAASFDERAVVEALLAAGADVKAADRFGRTPLHRAAECGAAEVVEALLNAGADVNATDAKGFGPIHMAGYSIWYRDFNSPLVSMLLARGAKVSLVATVSLGNIEQVEARLKEDPLQVNVPAPKTESDDQVTPLQMAINRGDAAVVKLLLDHKADPDVMRYGQTPLNWAVQHGRKDLLKMLLAAGAKVDLGGNGQGTPLGWAASRKDAEAVKLLLDAGADPNAFTENDSFPPLSKALSIDRGQTEEQAVPVVELLLARGANVNWQDPRYGFTPIFGRGEVLGPLLLKHGAKLDVRMRGGDTPLHYAAVLGERDSAVRFLLAQKVDVNARNDAGQTPLHMPFRLSPSPRVIELLLGGGADVNARDKQGRTPLHAAAERGPASVAELLIDAKADLGARDDSGATPLHLAAKLKRKEIVELLLKRGADADAKDNAGRTPAEWAEDEEVKAMLKAKA
jgi:ankyrin repeat protein